MGLFYCFTSANFAAAFFKRLTTALAAEFAIFALLPSWRADLAAPAISDAKKTQRHNLCLGKTVPSRGW
jgi:hypothetical protein